MHYGPPPEAFEAVAAFGGEPAEHHYRDAAGIPELHEGLRLKLSAENGIDVDDGEQVLFVTAGSNMAFYHMVLCACDPGDEVVVMSPFYFNHEMAIAMANCRAVLVPTDERYGLRVDAVEAAVTARTRMVVTISPNNPAGVVYDPEALAAVNDLCRRRGIYHVSDEAYEHFTYGARHLSPGSLPGSAGHTISLFSFSKSYGLANWRVGYAVAPRRLVRGLQKSQDTILICPPVVSQLAAAGALRAGPAWFRGYVDGLDRVRAMCLERLGELEPRCVVPEANGAFYLLARLADAAAVDARRRAAGARARRRRHPRQRLRTDRFLPHPHRLRGPGAAHRGAGDGAPRPRPGPHPRGRPGTRLTSETSAATLRAKSDLNSHHSLPCWKFSTLFMNVELRQRFYRHSGELVALSF